MNFGRCDYTLALWSVSITFATAAAFQAVDGRWLMALVNLALGIYAHLVIRHARGWMFPR